MKKNLTFFVFSLMLFAACIPIDCGNNGGSGTACTQTIPITNLSTSNVTQTDATLNVSWRDNAHVYWDVTLYNNNGTVYMRQRVTSPSNRTEFLNVELNRSYIIEVKGDTNTPCPSAARKHFCIGNTGDVQDSCN